MIEEGKSKAKKMRTIKLRGLGLPPVSRTAGGWPAVSGAVLETLAGDPDSAWTSCGVVKDFPAARVLVCVVCGLGRWEVWNSV
jgi:hypothetical protein